MSVSSRDVGANGTVLADSDAEAIEIAAARPRTYSRKMGAPKVGPRRTDAPKDGPRTLLMEVRAVPAQSRYAPLMLNGGACCCGTMEGHTVDS